MKTFLRLVVVTCLLLASGQALRIGVADFLFRHDTSESVKRAGRLWPSNAEFQARLADLDPDNAVVHLRRAVFLNPSRSRSWILLGLQLELHGNPEKGEQCYLKAAQSDRQFLPAWTLANFYFRRNDAARFWPWARNAARMSYGDLRPLFRLAFEMSDSVDTVFVRMIVPRRSVEHQFLQELLDRNLDATSIAKRILSHAGAEDVRPLLAWTNRLIETQRVPEARRLWNALGAKGLIPYPRTALIRIREKIGMSSELADESVCPTGGAGASACEQVFSQILTLDFVHSVQEIGEISVC
jgi:tetratricopeptide (TPR) repeat protein